MGRTDSKTRNLIKYQTLNDVVYEAIRKRIANLVIQPGDQLIEQQLSVDLGVSKSPVREALRRLERTGLIYVIPFKGCFASPLSVEEFKDAVELREALEVYCLSRGLPRYTDKDIREFARLEKTASKRLQEGQKEAASDIHLKVHRLIVKKAGNALIEKNHADLIENMLRRYLVFTLEQISNKAESWAQQHRSLSKAIEKRDVASAVSALQEHLRSIFDEALLSVSGKTLLRQADARG
jgi:DNA-binding GntR family transcriptional regulator